jgi:hypothetical protein
LEGEFASVAEDEDRNLAIDRLQPVEAVGVVVKER